VHDRAGVAAELGAVKVRLHLEFPDRFDRRAQDDRNSEPLVIIDAVVEEIVRPFAVAIRKQLAARSAVIRACPAHDRAAGAEAGTVDARSSNSELDEVAAVERQLIDKVACDDTADRRGLALEQRRGCDDVNGLADLPDLKREIDAGALVDLEDDASL